VLFFASLVIFSSRYTGYLLHSFTWSGKSNCRTRLIVSSRACRNCLHDNGLWVYVGELAAKIAGWRKDWKIVQKEEYAGAAVNLAGG
jgi:hypothetical protein